jgi:hypothetical protein
MILAATVFVVPEAEIFACTPVTRTSDTDFETLGGTSSTAQP